MRSKHQKGRRSLDVVDVDAEVERVGVAQYPRRKATKVRMRSRRGKTRNVDMRMREERSSGKD